MKLAVPSDHNDLSIRDKDEINILIRNIIDTHRNQVTQINRLVFDSVTSLTVGEARAKELQSRGFFLRFWGGLTGSNQKLQSEIDRNLRTAQYASQQMLQNLADQNLMSFELITAVNNKLNATIITVKEELNHIYFVLGQFFTQTRQEVIQIENRLEKLEKNVDLLYWNATIGSQLFECREYNQLNDIEKTICLTVDFFQKTKGEWDLKDLMLLKSTILEIGVSLKSGVTYQDIIFEFSNNAALLNRIEQACMFEHMEHLDMTEVPFIQATHKMIQLSSNDRFMATALVGQISKFNPQFTISDAMNALVTDFVSQELQIDLNRAINYFDLSVELLFSLKYLEEVVNSSIDDVDSLARSNDEGLKIGEDHFFKYEFKEATPYLERSAEKGNQRAIYLLGEIYYEGDHDEGFTDDKSLQYHEQGAKLGCSLCRIHLARELEDDREDQAKDIIVETFEEVLKLAEEGDILAQYEIGHTYDCEFIEEYDEEKSLFWWKKAANNGCWRSQVWLGISLMTKDNENALYWLNKAVEVGCPGAREHLETAEWHRDWIERAAIASSETEELLKKMQ